MSNVHTAKIGEIAVAKPPDKLQALALGSCVGLIVYDPVSKIAALAHVLLPEKSKYAKTNGGPGKYGPEATHEAIRQVVMKGGNKDRLVAKIAGGAKMFTGLKGGINSDIGQRNINSVEEALKENGIRLVGRDVGDNLGRTIVFDPESGILTVRQANGTILKTI